MSAIITFEPVKNIQNVKEKFKPIDNGYYRILIGGLGTYNSSGDYYEATQEVIDLFSQSSTLQRRINTGSLYAEAGHPKFKPGMTLKDYMRRLLEIEESRHIAHIRKIELIDKGNGTYHIVGEIKPLDNDLGRGLKSKLENPYANVAFSIRSFTIDKVVNGIKRKTIKQIITFDYVTEPGIKVANKWDTVGTERLSIDLEDSRIKEVLNEILEENRVVGNENSNSLVDETLECVNGICSCSIESIPTDVVTDW